MTVQRLSDLIIEAHNAACREEKEQIAKLLLEALELELSAIGGPGVVEKRTETEPMEEAFDLHEKTFGTI